ncbi:uncharacterized protein [Prorops nasuta]|uniref:uncharacterized protein n=1 Tax=Prorops nasuta TaxID=863751 RepID=UPI0034CEA6FD
MNSSAFVGNGDTPATGFCPAPPPPPPPPAPGQMPGMRINTAQTPSVQRQQAGSGDGYEPPAAIQNAMLTKDKKPFTYTPGMGGKLDLSQIRSPRMARRVAKNANDEGIEGPPKSAMEAKSPNQTTPPSLFVQPQVAVPVFPTNVPPPAPPTRAQPPAPVSRIPPPPIVNRAPATVAERPQEPVKNVTKVETKLTPLMVNAARPATPESPGTPPQVTLAKAPTPWLQNKKPQGELPEWAKRAPGNKSPSSPDNNGSATASIQVQPVQKSPPWQQQQPQFQQSPQTYQQSPQPYQSQPIYQQSPQPYQPQPSYQPPQQQLNQKRQQQQERVIPIRIEDRPSVFSVKNEAGHHQFKNSPSTHHQQRWGQQSGQGPVQAQPQLVNPSSPHIQQSGGGYIIPVQVEGQEKRSGPATVQVANSNIRNNIADRSPRVITQPVTQQEPGPLQSRSFRVLQKITDTDPQNDVDGEQLRKLQLTEEDRSLMNKFKEQVDGDTYLHQEEDPRYRGAAIPSRAFRYLQNMTDSGEITANAGPRAPNAVNKRQNRNSKSFEETQANLPPSEQQAPEPRKYVGGSIPSRSFRILQAMTAPESIATQENRQADFTCQTESSLPGNQQGVFFPPCPTPFRAPDGSWWSCYPVQYAAQSDNCPASLTYDPYAYFRYDNLNSTYYPFYNTPGYAHYEQNYPIDKESPNSRAPISGESSYKTSQVYCNDNPDQHGQLYNQQQSQQYSFDIENPNSYYNEQSSLCQDNLSFHNHSESTDFHQQQPSNEISSNSRKDVADLSFNVFQPVTLWERTSNVSATTSNDLESSTIAFNITDEESEFPNTTSKLNKISNRPGSHCLKNPIAMASVPNYTYIDTSDSNDSNDTDNEYTRSTNPTDSIGNCTSSNNNFSNRFSSNSSDSDDSDSYLAYSTGLNPQRIENNEDKDDGAISNYVPEIIVDTERVEGVAEIAGGPFSEELYLEVPGSDGNCVSHRLSVIYEDSERTDNESPHQSAKDDAENSATVSVSLPLRFKFSVSENNEDITTVIVGDSTVKPEKTDANYSSGTRIHEEGSNCTDTGIDCTLDRSSLLVPEDEVKHDSPVNESSESVSLAFHEDESSTSKDEDTVVDFIVKRQNNKRVLVETGNEENDDDTPRVSFTLRKDPSRVRSINVEENVETEFTIRMRITNYAKKQRAKNEDEDRVDINDLESNDNTEDSRNALDRFSIEDTSNTLDSKPQENFVAPEVVVSECGWGDLDQSNETLKDELYDQHKKTIDEQSIERYENKIENNASSESNEEPEMSNQSQESLDPTRSKKHLLSVQNSREETDDEDSGVTSDMSRIISEVDTDSECTSTRKMSRYKRTQTHSRLFRLLCDDTALPGDSNDADAKCRRELLSLPLQSSSNYDENYCSNYSSGLTSPEYSPVCEQSWRKMPETEITPSSTLTLKSTSVPGRVANVLDGELERSVPEEDAYFQTWKSPNVQQDQQEPEVVPSMAHRILESKMPYWAYKVNVLCPRIKSTKSVPQALRSQDMVGSNAPSQVLSISVTSRAKNYRC